MSDRGDDGDPEDERDREDPRPQWPPTETLLSELAGIGERVQESSLSAVWKRASQSAASRLFEWWVDADEETGGAEVLFEEKQVRTTGGATSDEDQRSRQGSTLPETGRWAEFVTSAGGLLEASRQVGERLGEDDARADDEWERVLIDGWQQLREPYPDLTDMLLRRMIQQSDERETFESPGRTVVTSGEEQTGKGGSSAAQSHSLWTSWLGEESGVEVLADRAVAVAFREVFGGAGEGEEELKAGESIDAERASGFMRALERIMMRLVETAFFEDGNEFPSDRKDDRDDQPTEETNIEAG